MQNSTAIASNNRVCSRSPSPLLSTPSWPIYSFASVVDLDGNSSQSSAPSNANTPRSFVGGTDFLDQGAFSAELTSEYLDVKSENPAHFRGSVDTYDMNIKQDWIMDQQLFTMHNSEPSSSSYSLYAMPSTGTQEAWAVLPPTVWNANSDGNSASAADSASSSSSLTRLAHCSHWSEAEVANAGQCQPLDALHCGHGHTHAQDHSAPNTRAPTYFDTAPNGATLSAASSSSSGDALLIASTAPCHFSSTASSSSAAYPESYSPPRFSSPMSSYNSSSSAHSSSVSATSPSPSLSAGSTPTMTPAPVPTPMMSMPMLSQPQWSPSMSMIMPIGVVQNGRQRDDDEYRPMRVRKNVLPARRKQPPVLSSSNRPTHQTVFPTSAKNLHACLYPGCTLAFARARDLKRHFRLHSGELPYSCDRCGAGFIRSDARGRHWKANPECSPPVERP